MLSGGLLVKRILATYTHFLKLTLKTTGINPVAHHSGQESVPHMLNFSH